MEGQGGEEGWGEEISEGGGSDDGKGKEKVERGGTREGKWDSGVGRCAITGRRLLGGREGLRRVIV